MLCFLFVLAFPPLPALSGRPSLSSSCAARERFSIIVYIKSYKIFLAHLLGWPMPKRQEFISLLLDKLRNCLLTLPDRFPALSNFPAFFFLWLGLPLGKIFRPGPTRPSHSLLGSASVVWVVFLCFWFLCIVCWLFLLFLLVLSVLLVVFCGRSPLEP